MLQLICVFYQLHFSDVKAPTSADLAFAESTPWKSGNVPVLLLSEIMPKRASGLCTISLKGLLYLSLSHILCFLTSVALAALPYLTPTHEQLSQADAVEILR